MAIAAAVERHAGILVSTQLEERLRALGQEHVRGGGGTGFDAGAAVGRVLHVLTEAYEWGGHTRVAERWILADSGRRSNVVITATPTPAVPATLQSVTRARGGGVLALPGGDLFTKAWNLRALAAQHDLVVLHVHMHDVVPVLAFADPAGRPPTIFFNHASHQLWIGVAAADVVANLQPVDDTYSRARRGVEADASLVLPIPITPRELPTREQARTELGLHPEVPLILACGTAHKVSPVLTPPFTSLIENVLQASPGAQCLAVGPFPDPEWAALEQRTGGRARALGQQPSPVVTHLMSAADVLLDTWPMSGGTTLLDAGYARLPVVSLSDGREELAIIRPPRGALGGGLVHGADPDSVAMLVADLLADPDRRAELGELGRAFVTEHHGERWAAQLDTVVAAAVARRGQAQPPLVDPPAEQTDWECVLHLVRHASGGLAMPPEALLARHAIDLPADERPTDAADAQRRIAEILASGEAPARRGVAAPPVDAASIAALMAEIRARVAAGEIGSCAVAVAPELLDQAIPLLEHELATGPDVEIELVAAADLAAVARPDDLVIELRSGSA